MPHLFEFMDQSWVPSSLRRTLREILECGNSKPFRNYYDWVVSESIAAGQEIGCDTIVELGAGTAPITRRLIKHNEARHLQLVVCDMNPDREAYQQLEHLGKGRISACYEPVDFSKEHDWGDNALLILSATLHHIPRTEREPVIHQLRASGKAVLIFEPLRNTAASYLFTTLSLVPAFLLPIAWLRRPGRLRRLFWCWLFPIAPITFWWDGIVSCMRQSSEANWRGVLGSEHSRDGVSQLTTFLFSQKVTCKSTTS